MSSLSLLQGIFPTQGLNPGLLHCRRILYQLSHQGSPRVLEWVAYPFSSGSSWPRNQTGDSCVAGRFFPSWATREAQLNKAWCIYSTEYFVALWLEKYRWGSTSHSDMERSLPKCNIRGKIQEQKMRTSCCTLVTIKGDDKFAFVCIQYLYPKYPVVGGKGYPLFLSRLSDFWTI